MKGLAQGVPAMRVARPLHAAPSMQVPSSRDNRVMTGLQREAAAVKVLDSIPAQSNVLGPVARGRWRQRQRDGVPGDMAFAKPQEKGTEKSWRQQRVGGKGEEGGGVEPLRNRQSVCLYAGDRGTTHRKVFIRRVSDRQAGPVTEVAR